MRYAGWFIRVASAACLALLAELPLACGGSASHSPAPRAAGAGGGPSPSVSATAPLVPASPAPRDMIPASLLDGRFPGLLLIADRGNDRLLIVDARRHVRWVYPKPGVKPAYPFRYDDDAFFTPGYRGVISSQEDQHTIQVISLPRGKVVWHYGHPNVAGSTAGYLNRPDDAYMRANGTVSVADIRNQRVLFISRHKKVVKQIGTTGVVGHDPPRLLGVPNGDTPLPGGGTLVTEIAGSWVSAISAGGHLEWQVRTPAAYPSDAQLISDGTILLADYVSPGKVMIIDRKGHIRWQYGPSSGPGMLDHPSLAIALPDGLIAVTDDYRDRVVLIDRKSRRIVWQYGHTDTPGTAPGYLNTPDGMDFLPFAALVRHPALLTLVGK
jgi:hypothetical protein